MGWDGGVRRSASDSQVGATRVCMVPPCLCWVLSWSLVHKDVQVKLIGDPDLSVGFSVSVLVRLPVVALRQSVKRVHPVKTCTGWTLLSPYDRRNSCWPPLWWKIDGYSSIKSYRATWEQFMQHVLLLPTLQPLADPLADSWNIPRLSLLFSLSHSQVAVMKCLH